MWYVYIIRSINSPGQEYIGATAYCAFPDKYKALAFEKYLKSHSSRAFANKRL